MESGGVKGLIKRPMPELFWRWYVDLNYAVYEPVIEMYGIERSGV
jgi:hypothetical protein